MEVVKEVATISPVAKVQTAQVIKEVPVNELPQINLTPISNWMVTTAFIEAADNSWIADKSYKPTFLNMQQVLAKGPRVEDVEVGDWVYIDMSRFIQTKKTKSTIRAGVGGADMITEQLVPPLFAAPGDPAAYFKINDREIEGVIKDPYSMEKRYDTLENYSANQDLMEKEAAEAKRALDNEQRNRIVQIKDDRKGPVIRTSTSPKLND